MGKGMNMFRLPFRWERMQPTQLRSSTTELSRMDAFVNNATAAGATVIIEPHNFQRYYPDPGNFQQSAQGLVRFRRARCGFRRFLDEDGRPLQGQWPRHLEPDERADDAADRAVGDDDKPGDRRHSRHGGDQTSFTCRATRTRGAHSGRKTGTARPTRWRCSTWSIRRRTWSYEVHQYFDYNSSGQRRRHRAADRHDGNPNNTNIGVERITAFTNWLKQQRRAGIPGRVRLANVASATSATAQRSPADDRRRDAQGDAQLHQANADVWEGWAWWGGGPWWDTATICSAWGPSNRNYVNPTREAPALPYLVPYARDSRRGRRL